MLKLLKIYASIMNVKATKAEPKRYNVDLVSNDEGLRDFRKPFFVLDSQRYMFLFCRI